MKVIDIRTSAYFSGIIIFLGVLFVILAFVLISTSILASVLFAVFALIIFTTHYRIRIDLEKKEFFDYLWILGTRHGERGKFQQLEYLFIRKTKVSETMRLKAVSSTIRREVFDAYLKLPDRKIHLLTRTDKDSVLAFMRRVAARIHVKVVDYTDGEPVEV